MKTFSHSRRILAVLTAGVLVPHMASAAPVVWNGPGAGLNLWSSGANWEGGLVPDASGDAKFYSAGATGVAVSNINNVVDAAFTGPITSLQYANTNGNHTTLIDPGVTLTISGGLTVGTETDNGSSQLVNTTITGPDAALVLSGGNLVVRQGSTSGNGGRATLNLSGLDTFSGTFGRFLVGQAVINRSTGTMLMAKTNTITVTGTAPAFDVGESASGNNGGGSILYLGITNAIFANSVSVGRVKESSSSILFNPAFVASSPVAYFRGSDGVSRVSTWTLGDGTANSGTASARGTNDFTGGRVDAEVNTMQVGRSTSNTGGGGTAHGILTFNNGTIDVNTLQVALQSASTTANALGNVNVNGTAFLNVNTLLEMGRTAGNTGAATTRAVLSINGGTVRASTLVANFASVNNTITINNGLLAVTNAIGAGINTFAMTNSFLETEAITGSPSMIVTNLTTGGSTNKIDITALPTITAYPAQYAIIKYTGAIAGAGFNFGVGTLPPQSPAYVGYISNNIGNSSIDVVITNGPVPAQTITWRGTPTGDWDIGSTANWFLGGLVVYNQGDLVRFDDTATGSTTVNLTTTFLPTSVTISNNTKNYTFTGGGAISGAVSLTKQGSGTLILDNSGVNDFTDGLVISGGTVQVGNASFAGNVGAGGIINNGVLSFNRADPVAVPNAISGTGSLTKNGPDNLTLSGANTFTGAVSVVQGTLTAGNGGALGTADGGTTVNNGATLDVNAQNLGAEPVTVQGQGNGSGVIVNNSFTTQLNALRRVTLANNATFGGIGRWDIRAPSTADPSGASLSTGGNPFNLTKLGLAQQISLVGVTVDPMLGNIDVQQGIFSMETATTGLGDPTKTLTVSPTATFMMHNATNHLNKVIVLNGDGFTPSLQNNAGANTIVGPITLNGACVMNILGTSLTLDNSIGGSGSLYKTGAGSLIFGATGSFSGGTTIGIGTSLINGTLGGGVIALPGTTLGGSGNATGLVDVQGAFNPGAINGIGTFTSSGGLTFEPGATLTFDLSATNTASGGVNDLLVVTTGDLTANNNSITINTLTGRLQPGSYRLINYSGALVGGFDPNVTTVGQTRYTFALDTSTAGQVNLIVSGAPANLTWNSPDNSAWDVFTTPNWSNAVTISAEPFFSGDTVTFNDKAGVTNTIVLGVAVTPFSVTNNSSANNFTITGTGKITGSTGIEKDGTSTLTLDTTNDFTGAVNIKAGTVKTGTGSALGATAGDTVISSGATLDVDGQSLGAEEVIVSGSGVGGKGAIVNSGAQITTALRFVTMVGNTAFGGTGPWNPTGNTNRWDIRAGGTPSTATLSTGGNAYKLTKVGSNQVSLVSVTVDEKLGDIEIQQGLLAFESNTTSMGDTNNTLTVSAGATMSFFNTTSLWNKVFVLNGDGVTATVTNWSGSNTIVGPMTLNGSCVFGVAGTAMRIDGAIGGSGSLTKNLGNPLYLSGVNTYNGNTFVNGGTMFLTGSGSIANSPNITVASGATLDVNGRVGSTLALAAGQTLEGNGTVNGAVMVGSSAAISPGLSVGILTIPNAPLNLGGTTIMEIDRAASTNDLIRGPSTITYGGTLNIVNLTTPLAAGNSFKLFAATNYLGSFSSIVPATPGAGLQWDTTALTSGILKVAAAIAPSIGTISMSGTNLTFTGTGGTPGSAYDVMTSSNVAAPLSGWTVLTSGTFDGSGNFSITAGVPPGNPQQFFVIRLQ